MSDELIYGYTIAGGAEAWRTYPELRERRMEMALEMLAEKMALEGFKPVGPLSTQVRYTVYIEDPEGRDPEDERYEGRRQEVETIEEASMVHVVLEIRARRIGS